MTCKEVYLWLLRADEPAKLPAPLRAHLRACPRCRRRRRRLLRLHQEVCALPPPAERPAARVALMARIDELAAAEAVPATVAAAFPALRRRWTQRALTVRAAAMLLVTAGFFWSLTLTDSDSPRAGAPPDNDVLARVLERHLQLAEGSLAPADRFQVLVGMAADLRTESLRLARQTRREDLPMVAGLYDKVLREGVVDRAGHLPRGDRRRLVEPLLIELRRAEAEAEQAAARTPGDAAKSLRGVATATRAARVQLGSLLEGKPL